MPRARAAGALVLLDAKRGDIGSTMDAYGDYLRPDHPLAVDAMTVSPYLGPGSLQPAVDTARLYGGGLFVLARTSNPDAGTFQHALRGRAVGRPGRRRHRPRLEHPGLGRRRPAARHRRGARPREPVRPATGSFGVVVGATLRDLDVDLDGLGGPILAPGLGAQGGSVADLRRLFGTGGPSSRRSPGTCWPPARPRRAAGRRGALDGGAGRLTEPPVGARRRRVAGAAHG